MRPRDSVTLARVKAEQERTDRLLSQASDASDKAITRARTSVVSAGGGADAEAICLSCAWPARVARIMEGV